MTMQDDNVQFLLEIDRADISIDFKRLLGKAPALVFVSTASFSAQSSSWARSAGQS